MTKKRKRKRKREAAALGSRPAETEGRTAVLPTGPDQALERIEEVGPPTAVPPPEQSNSTRENQAEKDVAFYEALANGWVATRLEFDRTLVALSAAGIGLFVTLLTTVGVRSRWEIVSYVLGSIGFVGTIGVGLWMFLRNAVFFLKLANMGGLEGDPVLRRLDRALVLLFLLGAAGALSAGYSAAVSKYHAEGGTVKSDPKQDRPAPTGKSLAPPTPQTPAHAAGDSLKGSIDGFQKLRPTPPDTTKSKPAPEPPPAKKSGKS